MIKAVAKKSACVVQRTKIYPITCKVMADHFPDTEFPARARLTKRIDFSIRWQVWQWISMRAVVVVDDVLYRHQFGFDH